MRGISSRTGKVLKDKDKDSGYSDDMCSFENVGGLVDILSCVLTSWSALIDDFGNREKYSDDDLDALTIVLTRNDRVYYVIGTLCFILLILFMIKAMSGGSPPPYPPHPPPPPPPPNYYSSPYHSPGWG